MAGINYSHSYTSSSTTRAFNSTYLGNTSRTLKAFFTGGYEKQYEGTYERQYQGEYIGYYGKAYEVLYEGNYTSGYIGYYTKAYEGSYTGLYEGDYTGYYTGTYEGAFEDTYEGIFTGYYTGNYEKAYVGQYTHLWEGGPYTRLWTGVYTGNYQHGPFEGYYSHLWGGDRTYAGSYTGQYSHAWSHLWEGDYIGYYTGVYTSTYSGWYTIATWEGTYESYGQGPENYSHVSYTQSTANWEKSYSAQYTGYFAGTGQYTGYFDASTSYTGYYTGGLAWEGVAYFHSGGGEGGTQWAGTRQWIQSGPVTYTANYDKVYYLYDGEPIHQQWSKAYVGSPVPEGNFASAWVSGDYYSIEYSSLQGQGAQYGQAYWISGSMTPGYYFPSFYNLAAYVGGYSGGTPVGYTTGHWLRSVAKQWTGAADWSGLRTHYSSTQFSKTYEGNWAGLYGGTAYYIGYWTGSYTHSVEKYYDGPNYTHVTSVTYTGAYEGYYTKLYEGSFDGNRTYAGQYQGDYTGYYGNYWEGTYQGQYEGLATYATKLLGIGNFEGTYEGVYTKSYSHAWEGTYTGQYAGNYERIREVNYSHIWESTYTGFYGNSYGKIYTHTWIGQYTHAYTGQYTKLYGGSWLGNTPTTYVGVSGNYTAAWVGNPSYDQIYSGTTTFLGLKTGELAQGGVARIKQSGAWKQTEAVHVKKDGGWKESKAIYIKKDGSWQLSHVGYDRTDVTLSSNQEKFNLRDYLVSQGKSIGTQAQMVNIIVDGCDIYSTDSTAAMDVSTGLGAINLGSNSIKHKVRILVHPDARIIGSAGHPGSQDGPTRIGNDATNGGDAIRTSPAVELFIENYGTIAAGGGGGGSGGYPVTGSTLNRVGGAGGYGAGYAVISSSTTNILESNNLINGSNSAVAYGIHGGSGGLLGQRGAAAGGFTHDDASLNEANDGALKTQYANSGNGGLPGAAIIGYDATRTTFINTGNVWGDSKYKLQA